MRFPLPFAFLKMPVAPEAPFVPPSGVTLWLRGEDLGVGDGNLIATWVDQSGASHNLTQGASGSRPTEQTGELNGYSIAHFDGTDDFIQADFTLVQPITRITVLKMRSQAATTLMDGGAGAGGNTFRLYSPNTNELTCYAGVVLNTALGVPDLTAYHVYSELFNGVSSSIRSDGVLKAAGDAGSVAAGGLTLGAHAAGVAVSPIDVAEVLIFPSVLSNADHNLVGNYLATKYGLTWTNL